MNVKWKKSLRDLTSNPKKALLVVFALSLGICGVGTVLTSYVILTNDLNQNYQSTIPPHVIFHSENFEKLDLNEFIKDPGVESAEYRDFSLHRIEARPNVWIPLWLYGMEDMKNTQIAKIFHERGEKIPGAGTILVERDGLNVSEIELGSSPRIRIGNKESRIKVIGICFDPAQAPATQDAMIYAYVTKQTYSEITNLPVNQRLIVRLKNVYSKTDVERISNLLASKMRNEGINIRSVEIPKFNEHPHQWQLNTLLFLIGTIGFLAFVMGAVLVSQLMRSILTSQIRQIGILKSVGASRSQILKMYLFMLFLIGVLSGVLAIPLAVKIGNAFSHFVAGKLNFDILTETLPIKVYIYLILASVFLPIIFSLSMLLKGISISVRNALSEYGVSQQMVTYQFKFLKRINFSYSMQLALRNALRNTKRLAVTILAMALGVAIFDTGFNVRQSLWELLSGVKNEMGYDIQVVLNKPVSENEAINPFEKLQNVDRTETWVGGRGLLQSKVIGTDKGVGIIALPINTELLKLKIIDGRWLKQSSTVEVVLNQQALSLYGNPMLNSKIDLHIRDKILTAKIVGITEQFEKAKIYMDINQYNSITNPERLVNTINFVAKSRDYKSVIELKKNIEKMIEPSDLDVLYVMSQAERVKIIYDHLDIILSVIIMLSFLVLTVSAIGMASATGINIWERTREIGVMRAIGATPKMIYMLFVTEGMVVSLVSIFLGLLLAYPLSKLAAIFFGKLMLGEGANLQFAFSSNGFWITVLVTLIFGFFASRIPARSAIKISTQQALAYE